MNEKISVQETEGSLTLVIDNRILPKNGCIFWVFQIWAIIWMGGLCIPLWAWTVEKPSWWAILPFIAVAFSLYGYLYSMLKRRWIEEATLSQSSLQLSWKGLLAPKPVEIPLAHIAFIALGKLKAWHNQNAEDNCGETAIMLSVFTRPPEGKEKRYIIGYWLLYEQQRQIFDAIQQFAIKQALPLVCVLHDENYNVTFDTDGKLRRGSPGGPFGRDTEAGVILGKD